MSESELNTKAQCQDLIFRFGFALDRGANAEAADLFAVDAVAIRPDGETYSGAAVRELLLKRPADMVTRHMLSNVLVTPTGEDTAEAVAYVVAYRVAVTAGQALPHPMPDTPQAAGDWLLHLRRTDGGWRISRWEATAALSPSH